MKAAQFVVRAALAALANAVLYVPVARADQWLETMKKQKSCITGLENAGSKMARANAVWLTDARSAFYLPERFERLLAVHEQYRDEIHRFAARYTPLPSTAEATLAALRTLESGQAGILAAYAALNEKDDAFVASIANVDEAVALIGDDFKALKEPCAVFAVAAVDEALSTIALIREDLADTQGYVTTAGQRRGRLFTSLYNGLQVRLAENYAVLADVSLDAARVKLTAAVLAETHLYKVHTWWTDAHGNRGLGEGLAGPLLQYQRPLVIMKRDLVVGEAIELEVQEHPALDAAVYQAAKNEVATHVNALRSAISTLEARGERGTLELQRRTNARRRTIIDKYAPSCGPAIDAFDRAAVAAETSGDFRASDGAYVEVVASCGRR